MAAAAAANAAISHRYHFNDGTANDSVGTAHGTPVDGPMSANPPTISGGQFNFNNPNFSPQGANQNHLVLPTSILPSSGSVTIEEWFTFTGSGFFTESWTFTDHAGGANPPGAANGQYLMHTISNPQGGPVPAAGGSSVAQSLAGFGGGAESRAFSTTPGLGFAGGGYLDDGGTYMSATVIDGLLGTLSYYVFRVSDGLGGLQSSIPAIPLSSYAFTDAYLGRSPFAGDNAVSGSFDEFRIYSHAKTAAEVLLDFQLGPNVVPEPASLALAAVASLAAFTAARRRRAAV
jgi:hypothetical protein